MGAVNEGYYGVCTYLKGVKGWCWLFSVAGNDKKRCCMEVGGSGQWRGGWHSPVLLSVGFQQLSQWLGV